MKDINLKDFLSRFHSQTKAGIITNKHGAIIEANEAAAELLNMKSKDTMKNTLMCSYVHRNGTFDFKMMLNDCSKSGRADSSKIKLRPRGKSAFRAEIHGVVIARTNQIFLIDWSLEDAELQPSISTEISSDDSIEDEEWLSL